MNKRKLTLYIIILCFCISTKAQKSVTGIVNDSLKTDSNVVKSLKNSLYIEIGGNAVYYSLNYERLVKIKPTYKLAFRAGVGLEPNSADSYLPLELNYLKGKKNDYLEIGFGFTPCYADLKEVGFGGKKEKTFQVLTSLRVGFRYMNPERSALWRIGVIIQWRSLFVNGDQNRYWIIEKRNYYSEKTIWDGIGESIMPWAGISFGKVF